MPRGIKRNNNGEEIPTQVGNKIINKSVKGRSGQNNVVAMLVNENSKSKEPLNTGRKVNRKIDF